MPPQTPQKYLIKMNVFNLPMYGEYFSTFLEIIKELDTLKQVTKGNDFFNLK
jgi:hypothetical protein